MREILFVLRLLQLYGHAAHNFCGHPTFFQDHEFFEEVYKQAEIDFDNVLERMIGLMGEDATGYHMLHTEVASILDKLPIINVKDNTTYYKQILDIEEDLCRTIAIKLEAGTTPGVEQLLGDIADKSETRQYKISRRLKK